MIRNRHLLNPNLLYVFAIFTFWGSFLDASLARLVIRQLHRPIFDRALFFALDVEFLPSFEVNVLIWLVVIVEVAGTRAVRYGKTFERASSPLAALSGRGRTIRLYFVTPLSFDSSGELGIAGRS